MSQQILSMSSLQPSIQRRGLWRYCVLASSYCIKPRGEIMDTTLLDPSRQPINSGCFMQWEDSVDHLWCKILSGITLKCWQYSCNQDMRIEGYGTVWFYSDEIASILLENFKKTYRVVYDNNQENDFLVNKESPRAITIGLMIDYIIKCTLAFRSCAMSTSKLTNSQEPRTLRAIAVTSHGQWTSQVLLSTILKMN